MDEGDVILMIIFGAFILGISMTMVIVEWTGDALPLNVLDQVCAELNGGNYTEYVEVRSGISMEFHCKKEQPRQPAEDEFVITKQGVVGDEE